MSTAGSGGPGEDREAARYGADVPGPPWILGHRGTPLEAPENTLSSLQRAVALGLDGFEYDVRACATGELCLLHDAMLERTSNAHGRIGLRTLPELFGVDCGSWFGARFAGEPLALLGEALDIPGSRPGSWPQHMIELKEDGLVAELERLLRESSRPLAVRVASFSRRACLEARDVGLAPMVLADEASEGLRQFVRDERIQACGLAAGAWETPIGALDWPCERWAWSVDEPADLLAACRRPLFGFNTNEPRRALATRALAALAPADTGAYPLEVPPLVVEPGALSGTEGEWCGQWSVEALVRNPFDRPVGVALEVRFERGAYDVQGLPARLALEPGERAGVAFRLVGGSWSPGGDPRLSARFSARAGRGRPALDLLLDATLHRVRVATLGEHSVRLPMLAERPGAPAASLTARRHRDVLVVAIENPGELENARTVVRLDGHTYRGGRSLRMHWPARLALAGEVEFSCGMEGSTGGRPAVRRWAGNIGEPLRSGVAGRLRATAAAGRRGPT